MKACRSCGEIKPLSAYYKHSQMSDGHLNHCKECKKEYQDNRRKELSECEEWVENERARHRKKYHRLNYKEKHKPSTKVKRRAIQGYKKRYPEKYKAQILSQRIFTPDGYEKHHWSYKKVHARDVIFLTPKDHAKAHRFIVYEQSEKMYRTRNGELLDTRTKHEEYLRSIGIHFKEKKKKILS